MTVLTEGRLEITIVGEISARKFDDDTTHRMSHCMKAVDFIVEFADRYLFIEFKDPQHPGALQYGDPQAVLEDFTCGRIDDDFKYKYRDSFLYEWASGRANKPIDYYVLFAWTGLDSHILTRRTDDLQSKIPLRGPDGDPWPFVRGCTVFNVESWNRRFPQWPINALY